MITFLITPAKSRRDSLISKTPACRLTFEMAETPALFDSLSVRQLKKLHSLHDSNLLQTVKACKSSRESLCNLSTCGELFNNKRSSIFGELAEFSCNNKRASICSTNSGIHPRTVDSATHLPPPCASPSPVVRLFDTSVLECDPESELTPANVFNNTLHKIHDELLFADGDGDEDGNQTHFHLQEVKVVHDERNDVVTSTQFNADFCITMLITRERPSQQTIEQYLLLADKNHSNTCAPRTLDICQSCECLPCKHRNWNVTEIRWEKQWQTQQFVFNCHCHSPCVSHRPRQITDVHCDHIAHILQTNGVLQTDQLDDAQHAFFLKLLNKRSHAPNSHHRFPGQHKKRRLLRDGDHSRKENDKAIMMQHLESLSSSTSLLQSARKHQHQHLDDQTVIASESGDECHEYKYTTQAVQYLPLVGKEDNGCSYISGDTLMRLLVANHGDIKDSEKCEFDFDAFVIIDCRYGYEYMAGHIRGALSVSDPVLIKLLAKANTNRKDMASQRIAWIFHCEYSKNRGPQTCKYFRKLDREMNAHRYPFVSYPHVYVLRGGYKTFWYQFKDCYHSLKHRIFEPFGYVSMWNQIYDDKRFVYSKFQQNVWKKEKKKKKTQLIACCD